VARLGWGVFLGLANGLRCPSAHKQGKVLSLGIGFPHGLRSPQVSGTSTPAAVLLQLDLLHFSWVVDLSSGLAIPVSHGIPRVETCSPSSHDHVSVSEGRFHQPHVVLLVLRIFQVNWQPLCVL
jgi:hypothetical protein